MSSSCSAILIKGAFHQKTLTGNSDKCFDFSPPSGRSNKISGGITPCYQWYRGDEGYYPLNIEARTINDICEILFYFWSYSSSVTGPDHTAPPKSVFRLTAMWENSLSGVAPCHMDVLPPDTVASLWVYGNTGYKTNFLLSYSLCITDRCKNRETKKYRIRSN